MRLGDRKNAVEYLCEAYQVCIYKACTSYSLPKSVLYYCMEKDESVVIDKLNDQFESKQHRGFPNFFWRIRDEGLQMYIGRYNRRYPEYILHAYLFEDIAQLRELTWNWMKAYDLNHPYKSLYRQSSLKYIEKNIYIFESPIFIRFEK